MLTFLFFWLKSRRPSELPFLSCLSCIRSSFWKEAKIIDARVEHCLDFFQKKSSQRSKNLTVFGTTKSFLNQTSVDNKHFRDRMRVNSKLNMCTNFIRFIITFRNSSAEHGNNKCRPILVQGLLHDF